MSGRDPVPSAFRLTFPQQEETAGLAEQMLRETLGGERLPEHTLTARATDEHPGDGIEVAAARITRRNILMLQLALEVLRLRHANVELQARLESWGFPVHVD